jgi:tRNA isopentenyl-2-thiomethyl-A-37 hydroxylase MiaE
MNQELIDKIAKLEKENLQLKDAIKNWFKVQGRYHSQIAAARMAELVGLPAHYPEGTTMADYE